MKRLALERLFLMEDGMYGRLYLGEKVWWTMERRFRANLPSVSAVACGDYIMEPHGWNEEAAFTKHDQTWALVGNGVGRHAAEGIARYAILFHSAATPDQLEGCIAPTTGIHPAGFNVGSREAMDQLRTEIGQSQAMLSIYGPWG